MTLEQYTELMELITFGFSALLGLGFAGILAVTWKR